MSIIFYWVCLSGFYTTVTDWVVIITSGSFQEMSAIDCLCFLFCVLLYGTVMFQSYVQFHLFCLALAVTCLYHMLCVTKWFCFWCTQFLNKLSTVSGLLLCSLLLFLEVLLSCFRCSLRCHVFLLWYISFLSAAPCKICSGGFHYLRLLLYHGPMICLP